MKFSTFVLSAPFFSAAVHFSNVGVVIGSSNFRVQRQLDAVLNTDCPAGTLASFLKLDSENTFGFCDGTETLYSAVGELINPDSGSCATAELDGGKVFTFGPNEVDANQCKDTNKVAIPSGTVYKCVDQDGTADDNNGIDKVTFTLPGRCLTGLNVDVVKIKQSNSVLEDGYSEPAESSVCFSGESLEHK